MQESALNVRSPRAATIIIHLRKGLGICYCLTNSISKCDGFTAPYPVTRGIATDLSRIHIDLLSNNSTYYLFERARDTVYLPNFQGVNL